MKPDFSAMVHHHAECQNPDCDWEASAKNCIGLASQHAEKTGHEIHCETGHHYRWNSE